MPQSTDTALVDSKRTKRRKRETSDQPPALEEERSTRRRKTKGDEKSTEEKKLSSKRKGSSFEAESSTPTKKRKKQGDDQEAEQETVPEEPQSDEGVEDAPITGPKKRRKRKRRADPEADLAGLTEEEKQRRQRQRELRELALKMRAEGKKYERPPKRQAEAGSSTPRASKLARFAEARETGSRPDHPVEVIVVPIFWNTRHHEKAEVIRNAAKAVELLKGAGVQTGMDVTDALTPGQKFSYWEHKGVMVRLECGPRDVAGSQCVLAVGQTAGEVAQKQTLEIGPKLLRAVGRALKRDVTPAGPEESEAMEVEGPGELPRKHKLSSGDDLGGDFGLETAASDSAGKKKAGNKRRKTFLRG